MMKHSVLNPPVKEIGEDVLMNEQLLLTSPATNNYSNVTSSHPLVADNINHYFSTRNI